MGLLRWLLEAHKILVEEGNLLGKLVICDILGSKGLL